jgi:hypothetical protein
MHFVTRGIPAHAINNISIHTRVMVHAWFFILANIWWTECSWRRLFVCVGAPEGPLITTPLHTMSSVMCLDRRVSCTFINMVHLVNTFGVEIERARSIFSRSQHCDLIFTIWWRISTNFREGLGAYFCLNSFFLNLNFIVLNLQFQTYLILWTLQKFNLLTNFNELDWELRAKNKAQQPTSKYLFS